MRLRNWLMGGVLCASAIGCSDDSDHRDGGGAVLGIDGSLPGFEGGMDSALAHDASAPDANRDGYVRSCTPHSCAEIGWACGYTVDSCGRVLNCADEGRTCPASQVCTGGLSGPTACTASPAGMSCDICDAVPDCRGAAQPTRLTGRVVTPGRSDGETQNQLGVPNAVVYIVRSDDPSVLPAIASGIPSGGTSCDRCQPGDTGSSQELGPVLTGAVSDATGNFVIEGNIPTGKEFLLVVKAGKFRRAVRYTVPASAACQTTALPSDLPANPTRLPRNASDGLAVHIPQIAVSTGRIDAMECVFRKMGIASEEFGDPGADGSAPQHVHLYRGGPTSQTAAGARIDDNTPFDATLYSDLARLERYDMIVSDCEGQDWDGDPSRNFTQRNQYGANVREYVNRGGRLFASHLSFSWLYGNGTQPYMNSAPIATGLGQAASWETTLNSATTGTGRISLQRPLASPHIQSFAAWMVREGVTTVANVNSPTDNDYNFMIREPRSQCTALNAGSEEFVVLRDGTQRVQQFSFNTPFAAPADASCGRVAYSGFHVSVGGGLSPYASSMFPTHCEDAVTGNNGILTPQEKVLLYMLFDLGACIGNQPPVPPPCAPATCQSLGAQCGFSPDGCGGVLDCGACVIAI